MTDRESDPRSPSADTPERPLGPRRTPAEEVSLLSLAEVLLRRRWVVVGAPVVLAFLLVAHGFLFTSSTWTSTGSFTPQVGQEGASRLQGLASQFGVRLSSDGAAQSPRFYADLLRSKELLTRVVRARYGGGGGASSADSSGGGVRAGAAGEAAGRTLIEVYGIEADDSASATAAAVRTLRGDLSVTTDRETGVVTFSASLPEPELARQVGGRLLDALHSFNLRTRQSRASAERQFLEERVRQARADLRAAEDSLQIFLENNRRYQNSPTLVFERQRLQRRVDLQQQIYTSLSQSLEEARIDEVRTTPVITVVEEPDRPVRPDGRGLTTRGFLGLFLGGLAGLFWAFGAEYVARAREEEPEEYGEVAALLAQARRDLRGALRRLRELVGGG